MRYATVIITSVLGIAAGAIAAEQPHQSRRLDLHTGEARAGRGAQNDLRVQAGGYRNSREVWRNHPRERTRPPAWTDPIYGIGGFYEGIKAAPEQEKHNVFRVDPKTGNIKVVVDDFVEPNGITFSPDEKKLYIIDTGFTDGPNNPSHIRVFDADVENGKLSNSKVFAELPKPSITDGMRRPGQAHLVLRWLG